MIQSGYVLEVILVHCVIGEVRQFAGKGKIKFRHGQVTSDAECYLDSLRALSAEADTSAHHAVMPRTFAGSRRGAQAPDGTPRQRSMNASVTDELAIAQHDEGRVTVPEPANPPPRCRPSILGQARTAASD